MPMYQYECKHCGHKQEAFFRIKARAENIPCGCGADAVRVMSIGGIQGDELPSWLRDDQALGCLQPKHERRIESRSEYKRYLKARGIEEHGR